MYISMLFVFMCMLCMHIFKQSLGLLTTNCLLADFPAVSASNIPSSSESSQAGGGAQGEHLEKVGIS